MQQQDAAVPQVRIAVAQVRKMRIDLRPALLRERPKLGGKPQLETFESDHLRLRHQKAPVVV